MSYRKIDVAGREYEYTIGKTHTKIKGIGVFHNEDIGTPNTTCPNKDIYGDAAVSVTPANIKRKISEYC
jgi:hypothetical protein